MGERTVRKKMAHGEISKDSRKGKRLRSSGKGRGWNLRKGAKDYGKTDFVEAGRKGGLRKVKKGFAVTPRRKAD